MTTVRARMWTAVTATSLVVVAGAALWLTARHMAPSDRGLPVLAPEIQVRFDHITLRGRTEGGRRWELAANSVEVTTDQRRTRLRGLRRATLYAGDQPELSVRAGWAVLESPSRDMELSGGVEVSSPAGMVLRADRLRWRSAEERLDSVGPVEMTLGDTSVRAPHARYLARSQRMVCEGGVQILQGPNHLAGAKLVADLAAQTLEIVGGVRMQVQVAEGNEMSGAEGPLGAMKGLLDKAPKEGT